MPKMDSQTQGTTTDSSTAPSEMEMHENVGILARTSTALDPELKAINPTPGSCLDPQSPDFDTRAWVKALVKLYEGDPHAVPERYLGVAFRDLDVYGWNDGAQYQPTTASEPLKLLRSLIRPLTGSKRGQRIEILRGFEGVIGEGEMLLVLGPPGSGCSTLLKTLAGQTEGFTVSPDAKINYRGIKPKHIRGSLRGEVLYNAEIDAHLAHLTVGETLSFAARARANRFAPAGCTRAQVSDMMKDAVMAVMGISHTADTRVGNDFIRGVSGGERKRVSIAEAALTGAKLQCWDNSTRGLDSANAIKFCQNLRHQADLLDVATAVAIYQGPQSAYELFHRVTVLYEGRQIYFGPISEAKTYFEDLGFECPDRQTTPDFLTSMTSASERIVRQGFEDKAPRTPDEFAERWRTSDARQKLLAELDAYEKQHPLNTRLGEYRRSRRVEQAPSQRPKSPYIISYHQQVGLTFWRAWRRLLADPWFTIAQLLFNLVMAIMLGTVFLDLKQDTSSFYYRGGVIFFSLLFNAFASMLEVLTVYAERDTVQKQDRYAFYHKSAQAIASYLIDLPYKTLNMFIFNTILYFMTHLRRDAGAFFFFCLGSYLSTLIMSALFRTLACLTRTPAQAMVPSAVLSLGLMIYTGFTIPPSYMLGWSRWMGYINPLSYAFEALMSNEFDGRQFPCANMTPQGPGYDELGLESRICAVVGAQPSSSIVDGGRYLDMSFGFQASHKWRNIGILFAFLTFFFLTYVTAAEFMKPRKSKGEVLVFRRGKMPQGRMEKARDKTDVEAQPGETKVVAAQGTTGNEFVPQIAAGTAVFHWENLCYDVKIKGKERRILDHVDGWVKPGASTALMGVSGAGKTTLLDVLATRVTVGVVSGETMIDGLPTDTSFQHRVGYVQQQDLHLNTMTVREALEFSALLRQSAEIPRQEKLAYVDQVIGMLEMQDYADAVVGVQGEGLNVEQRKRLTIGVELAARPQLLLFLDEPTSGLDSQTSWSIVTLIKKLTNSGQAVLCTIHQPSAMLFTQFDRLLLLAPGGKTVYFGDMGENSTKLISYLESQGAPKCPADANPAEWMLQVIAPTHTDDEKKIDWHEQWRKSSEYSEVKKELSRLRSLAVTQPASLNHPTEQDASQHREFVASFWVQLWQVLLRTSKHFWRSPTYIWSKALLIIISCLYLGFSFSAKNSIQGLQNQLYAMFMLLAMFGNINEQIMPMFLPQRDLFEVRERPSKIYKWTTFVLSNILVEAGWNTLTAVVAFFCWYYPVGFVMNTTSDDQQIRGFLVFLFLWMYLLFTSTFSHLVITWIESEAVAGILATLIWMLCIACCGVAVPRVDLPDFWIFMYRLSPATYLISGIMSACLANSEVVCSPNELLHMQPPQNMTCGEFLTPYATAAHGVVLNPAAADMCTYCPLATTNDFLGRFDILYSNRWRDFGLLWVYIVVNVAGAMALYWVWRVPKGRGTKRG